MRLSSTLSKPSSRPDPNLPAPQPGRGCQLLCCQSVLADRPRHVPWHSHSCWQLELFRMGNVRVRSETLDYVAGCGESLLIPPRVSHAFEYPTVGTEWVSFAFRNERFPEASTARRIHPNAWNEPLRDALIALEPQSHVPESPPVFVLERLLDAFTALYDTQASPAGETGEAGEAEELSLSEQIRQYVHQYRDWPLRVQDVAHATGYSLSHVSAHFRAQEGEALKRYIDRVRADHAMRQLRYTDLSISEIAARMRFNDLYTFSRFFRRMTGLSPRAYRSREHAPVGQALAV